MLESDRSALESRPLHLLAVCVTLGEPLNISEPQFSHLKSEKRYFDRWLGGLGEIERDKCLAQYLRQVPWVIEMDCLSCKMLW